MRPDDKLCILLQDGKEKFRGTENECYIYLQSHTSYSWDHAFKYEGWMIAKDTQ